MTAPIALFAYRRPDHLRRVIESLRLNAEAAESDLYLFCDGPRSQPDERPVQSVRAYAKNITGFRSVQVILRERNYGLSESIIQGVTQMLKSAEHVIVLEDDLVVSRYFLEYMNAGLQRYKDMIGVASIHGYVYPVSGTLPETFFMRGADCWGWGTWRRAWAKFRHDGRGLLEELQQSGEAEEFDFGGTYQYMAMLRDQIEGRNDSWAIRWHASTFLADMLTLYPGRSLVQNIGNDASGTHCGDTDHHHVQTSDRPVVIKEIPMRASKEGFCAFQDFFKSLQAEASRSWFAKLRRMFGSGLR